MHEWHAKYLAAAARCRKAGRYADARRWISRAKGARLVYQGGKLP